MLILGRAWGVGGGGGGGWWWWCRCTMSWCDLDLTFDLSIIILRLKTLSGLYLGNLMV